MVIAAKANAVSILNITQIEATQILPMKYTTWSEMKVCKRERIRSGAGRISGRESHR